MDENGRDLCLLASLSKQKNVFAVSGLAIHPRGLREKSCTVSQPVSLATISAL